MTTKFQCRESDELRLRWLAWCGKNKITHIEACRMLGKNFSRIPHWASQGRIPINWRLKIQRQIGEVPA